MSVYRVWLLICQVGMRAPSLCIGPDLMFHPAIVSTSLAENMNVSHAQRACRIGAMSRCSLPSVASAPLPLLAQQDAKCSGWTKLGPSPLQQFIHTR